MAMNLLAAARRAFGLRSAATTGPTNPQARMWFPNRGDAGVHVTHGIAFMQAAVWACIDVVSSSLASSDWNVYTGIRGGNNKTALPDDRTQFLLNTRVNPEMTAQAGKRAMLIAAVGYGNGYAEIEWDMAGRMVALWPLSPDRVEPMRDEYGRFVYRVTQDYQGGFVDLDPVDVFHIRGASLTGSCGDDMIAKAVRTIARSVAVDQFSASYFSNGTQMGGVIEYPNKLDDPTFVRLKEQINSGHQGVKNAFRTLFLEAGGKFTQFNANAESSQLVDVKNQLVEEVCRWFRVPPHKVAYLLRATNNNIEHQGLEFSRDTLRPWVKEIEQESDYKLFSARGARRFVELDVDWASEGDFGSRMEAFGKGINTGVYSVNDVRRKLGENTIGVEGDVRMVQGAMTKLADVGKNMTPAPAPTAAPLPADKAANDDEGPAKAVAMAWVTSVYQRVQRRKDNRAYDLQRSGRAAWKQEAEADARAYAAAQVDEMAAVLGGRAAAVRQWADQVVDGCDPAVAAAAAFQEGTE